MDKISLNGIKADVIIGTFPDERIKRQPITVDVDIFCDLSAAGKSDELADTVDYFSLEEQIYSIMINSSFFLLEKLAETVAACVLKNSKVSKCHVRIAKPCAMRYSDPVTIEIERSNGEVL